ncbi:ABC transporter permease, partial [Acidithiobacillus caldus]|uniref:ABC transporter permease n=1 Tax=Acidithiobacillus caldus TaxID=33059 RepID=UPI001C07E2E2
YQGAALGFLWSLGNPLALILLYYFVFTHVFRSDMPHYILYLVIGVLHYNLFSQIASQSCDSLIGAAGLLQKIYFPRILIPVANVIFNLVLWIVSISILFVLYPIIGGTYHWVMLLYPLVLMMYILFILGIALLFSVLNVEFRDLKHLVDIAIMALFWFTPVGYNLSTISPNARHIIELSPLTVYMELFHELLYSDCLPDVRLIMTALMWSLASLFFGLYAFRKSASKLIESL